MADTTALPKEFFDSQKETADSLFSLREYLKTVDQHSFTGLKDLNSAVEDQSRAMDALRQRLEQTEEGVENLNTKVREQEGNMSELETLQSRLSSQIQEMGEVFARRVQGVEDRLDDAVVSIKQKVEKVAIEHDKSNSNILSSITGLFSGAAALGFVRGIVVPAVVAGVSGVIANAIGQKISEELRPLKRAIGWTQENFPKIYDFVQQFNIHKTEDVKPVELTPEIKALEEESKLNQQSRQKEQNEIDTSHPAGQQPTPTVDQPMGSPEVGRGGPDATPVRPYGSTQELPIKVANSGGNGYEQSGLSKAQVADMIRTAALARGIDPNVAIRVAQSEGLSTYASTFHDSKVGGQERSYGPFQLYMDGGEGNTFMAKTGINPATDRSANSIQKQIEYALDVALKKGWGPWHGAKRVGISNWQGIGTVARQQTATPSSMPVGPATTPATEGGATTGGAPQAAATTPSSGGMYTSNPVTPVQKESVGGIPSSDIVALGKMLQSKEGLRVSEHPAFGGVGGMHHGRGHYEGRAIDVNVGKGVEESKDPALGAKFDALAEQLRKSGYKVLWRTSGHYDHMHVEVPRNSQIGQVTEEVPTAQIPQGGAQPIPLQAPAQPMNGYLPPLPTGNQGPMSPMPMVAPLTPTGAEASMLMGNMGMGGNMGMLSQLIGMIGSSQAAANMMTPNLNTPMIKPIIDQPVTNKEETPQNINIINQQQAVSRPQLPSHNPLHSRPEWLGHLAEGLLGSTYSGGRVKSFGAGLGKM